MTRLILHIDLTDDTTFIDIRDALHGYADQLAPAPGDPRRYSADLMTATLTAGDQPIGTAHVTVTPHDDVITWELLLNGEHMVNGTNIRNLWRQAYAGCLGAIAYAQQTPTRQQRVDLDTLNHRTTSGTFIDYGGDTWQVRPAGGWGATPTPTPED